MGYDGTVPEECMEFCFEQYARFGIPAPREIADIVSVGASYSFYHCDVHDPYALFWGASDVILTDEWSKYTFEIKDDGRTYEASPEYFETFRYVPDQCEEAFQHLMSHPGAESLPNNLGYDIDDYINGEYTGESAYQITDPDALEVVKQLCTMSDGVVDWTRIRAYYKLAAWAGFAWLAGPPGRIYRMDYHGIFRTAIQYGEAILLDGSVIAPDSYRRLDRPPISCHVCGISAWCTELTMSEGSTRYICEHCNSEGMPPIFMATCGAKRCMLAHCLHHPSHSMGVGGMHHAYRNHGQLVDVAKGNTVIRLNSNNERLLIGGK